MITDNSTNSYAVFIYNCDLIQWAGLDPIYAKIGISFGGGMETVHVLSGNDSANGIDCIHNDTGSEWVNLIYDLNEMFPSPTNTFKMPQTSTLTPSASIVQLTPSSPGASTLQLSSSASIVQLTPSIPGASIVQLTPSSPGASILQLTSASPSEHIFLSHA